MLATNSELRELDEAAIRPGRFDFQLKMDHPVLAAQDRYVRSELRADDPGLLQLVRDALALVEQERLRAWDLVGKGERERNEAPLPVTFSLLTTIIRDLNLRSGLLPVDDPHTLAGAILERLNPRSIGPPSLISEPQP